MIISKITHTGYNNYNKNNKITPIFKGEYEDRVKSLRGQYNAVSWWWSGEDDSRELVAKNMRNEISDLKAEVTKKQVERDGLANSLQDLRNYYSSLLSSKKAEIATLKNQQNNNLGTIRNLENSLSDLGYTLHSLKSSNEEYRSVINKQEQTKNELNAKNEEVRSSINKYKEDIDKDIKTKIKKLHDEQEFRLNELKTQVDSLIKTPDNMKREMHCPTPDGFGSIAGYKEQKEQIKKVFGQAVILEKYGKTADVPNGLLLYGPDIDFNNIFATKIAKQYGCNLVEYSSQEDDAGRLKGIRQVIAEAKSNYEKTGKRTVILVKDFEKFAPKESRIVGPLKSLMDNVSESHATIVATTMFPENLDDILIRSSRFQAKIAIPPADYKNILEMIKIYLDPNILATIDMDTIAKKILAIQTDGAFSVKALKGLIQNIIPDIKQTTIKSFEKQINIMKGL